MAKYLVRGRYPAEGARGVEREGGDGRRDAIDRLAASLRGSLKSFFFAFGESDTYIVAELASHDAAAGSAPAVDDEGTVGTATTVLLTPERVDAAPELSWEYRPPGEQARLR